MKLFWVLRCELRNTQKTAKALTVFHFLFNISQNMRMKKVAKLYFTHLKYVKFVTFECSPSSVRPVLSSNIGIFWVNHPYTELEPERNISLKYWIYNQPTTLGISTGRCKPKEASHHTFCDAAGRRNERNIWSCLTGFREKGRIQKSNIWPHNHWRSRYGSHSPPKCFGLRSNKRLPAEKLPEGNPAVVIAQSAPIAQHSSGTALLRIKELVKINICVQWVRNSALHGYLHHLSMHLHHLSMVNPSWLSSCRKIPPFRSGWIFPPPRFE